jgi:hypothetical protein
MIEDEVAIKVLLSLPPYTLDGAAQVLGQKLAIATNAARETLDNLILRKLIEPRPEPGAAKNVSEPGHQLSAVRVKWFRVGMPRDKDGA